ncbi:MAG: hypothetical protein OIF48_09045 [Silicimonas sp.]|nr:hypothetical protein [Silicimonas sp.]
MPEKDDPTGPPPTFEESLLERQARVAFDPPELPPRADELPPPEPVAAASDPSEAVTEVEEAPPPAPQDPPPTRTDRAEASFTETKALAEAREPATVDVRG